MNLNFVKTTKIMVTGHNNSPFLILSVISPFQTVLFKIYENNYTSKVEKRLIVNDFYHDSH